MASLPLFISLACVRKASSWRVDGVECVSDSEARLHVLDRERRHAADDVERIEAVVPAWTSSSHFGSASMAYW
tara:strand:+ start:354 stop:572 length:219 start_codon:yes stop_codon:yes gene_type:complete